MKFLKNKAKKALMAAVTMSLVMGVYGCASAADLYGAQMSKGDTTITQVTPTGSATIADGDATNTGANYTVEGGYWNTVFGGYSNSSSGKDATYNKVTINKDALAYEVFGGRAHAGNANNNEVIIYGTVYNNVYGAQAIRSENTPNPTEANNNKVTIEGTVNGDVYGGFGNKVNNENVDDNISVIGNTVIVAGTGTAKDTVYGGWSYNKAEGNTVTISGTAEENVIGGDAKDSANKNTVIVTGTAKGEVYGGWSQNKAEGNTVTVSGTAEKNVYGAYSYNKAEGNTVTVSGTAEKDVYGGFGVDSANKNDVTINGTAKRKVVGGKGKTSANGNKVTITSTGEVTFYSYSGSDDDDGVYGGWSNQTAKDNEVNVSGTVKIKVYGGYSETGNVDNNTVTASGDAEIRGRVYAGYTKTGDVGCDQGNKLTIEGGNLYQAYAGYSVYGNVKNNIAVIEGGEVTILVGGLSGNGIANNNKATISDGKVYSLFGGYSENNAANNNEVTVYGGEVIGVVYGGYSETGTADTNTINLGTKDGGVAKIGGDAVISCVYDKNEPSQPGKDVLNVYGSGHTIGEDLYATKANLNFYIKADDLHAGGNTMLKVTGTANITDSTINAGVMNVGQVDVGDKITLLSAGTLNADATLKTGTLSDGIIDVDLQIAQEGNSITATAGKAYVPEEPPKEDPLKENNANANPNAKSPVATMAAAISLLNAGSDMLATSSIMNAEQAVQMEKENAEAEGGMTVFTTVSGSNKRISSGSHVDMKAWNANLGLAKEIANKSGKFLFAPVVEYGRGSYDSYLDNGVHGEGDSHFVGGGLLAKQTFNSNWYVDGSVRAGRMSADYKTADIGTGISYDNSATYYAAHLGAGKVVKMTEKSSMDYYGKLFYSHQNSSTANLSSGHTYEFDAVDSFRTLLGFRYSQKAGKTAAFYTGLAWQHEFDSECNATVRTGAWSAEAPAPSVKGDTGILEVGYKFTPGNSGNFDVDFGAAGYVGKQRGGSLKLNMQWKF